MLNIEGGFDARKVPLYWKIRHDGKECSWIFFITCTMVQKSLFRFPLRSDSGEILLLMAKEHFPKKKRDQSLLLCCLLKEHCNGNVKVMVSINVI